MAGLIEWLYLSILRVFGAFGVFLCGVFFWHLPSEIARGSHMLVPGIISIAVLVACAAFVFPFLTPAWVRRPIGWAQGAGVMVIHTVFPFLFMIVAMGAVIPLELAGTLPPEQSKSIGVLLAAIGFFASAVLWWLGLVLACIRPAKSDPDDGHPTHNSEKDFESARTTDTNMNQPTLESLRSLRKSRMAKMG